MKARQTHAACVLRCSEQMNFNLFVVVVSRARFFFFCQNKEEMTSAFSPSSAKCGLTVCMGGVFVLLSIFVETHI